MKEEAGVGRDWIHLLLKTGPGRELRQISALETKSWRGTRSARYRKSSASGCDSEFRINFIPCIPLFMWSRSEHSAALSLFFIDSAEP